MEILGHLAERWPTGAAVAALLVGVYLLARYWASAEMRDMRERVDYLDEQVRALRYRDQAYFEYILYDEEYHRKLELIAIRAGYTIERHISFLEFRDAWMKERGLTEEQDSIWQT